MKLNYDIINIFLILFIFYYLLFIISQKYNFTLEGVTNAGDLMCRGNSDPSDDFDTCSEWPFEYLRQAETTKQCIDGSGDCDYGTKIRNCCGQRAEMCQGNIDNSFSDWTCRGENDIPKMNATQLPHLCDVNSETECWDEGRYGGIPPGLDGCDSSVDTCNLSNLQSDELRQNICCTNSNLYSIGESMWGRPHFISAAILIFNEIRKIKNTRPSDVDELLNEALEHLHQAKELSDEDQKRAIIENYNDWSRELQRPIGIGMCRGNIDETDDFSCGGINKEFVNDSFIRLGSSIEECCIITGLCSGNTNSNEDVDCPESSNRIDEKEGTTIEECCSSDIKCRGNENIYINFNCPEPMVPIFNANETYGNTEEECCRFPGDINVEEMNYISEGETIRATLIFNGSFLISVGEEESSKRFLFETNFKKDIIDILNKDREVKILEEQININKIYKGSIMVDFEIIPHYFSNISISKEYFTYLLSERLFFPRIELKMAAPISDITIISWYNINHWPKWIWIVITSVITFFVSISILL